MRAEEIPMRPLALVLLAACHSATRDELDDLDVTAPDLFEDPGEGVVYLYTPDGFGASPVSAALDKMLRGVPWTARNWNTVLKLQEMAEAASRAS